MSPGLWQILLVVGIFAILFLGPKRLPGIGKSMGEAIKGFKKGITDDEIDVTETAKNEARREQLTEDADTETSASQSTSQKQNSKEEV